MLHYLRKIRRKLIVQDNVKKYLLYAFGEILLVVIGILIALQVSNWNQERIERTQLNIYYSRIQEELTDQLVYLATIREAVDELISLNKRSIEIYNTNNPDSLIKLEETIGALGTAWTANYTIPVLEEFLGSEYFSKVENPVTKKKLRTVRESINEALVNNQFTINQYQSVLEPYIIKNLNYQNSALPRYQKFLIPGGPKTDYTKFYSNLEFWNVLTLKYENLNLSRIKIINVEQSVKELITQLDKELTK